jgi:TPR repeat protein
MNSLLKNIALIVCLIAIAGCVPKKQPQTMGLKSGIASFQKHDYKSAFAALYPLAVEGNADAQYAIGYMIYYGKAGAANTGEGMDWINKAAAQGNPLAQRALGIFYTQANMTPEKRT